MNRILFYQQPQIDQENSLEDDLQPVTWFDGVYMHNEIPLPVLFNKKKLVNARTGELILQEGQRYFSSDVQDILRIEWHEQGSIVRMSDHTFWTTEKLIDQFEQELAGLKFFRVHPHHLVNIHYVERFVICDAFITLSNSEAIPVDSGNDPSILEFLNDQQLID